MCPILFLKVGQCFQKCTFIKEVDFRSNWDFFAKYFHPSTVGCHPCPPGGLVSAKALWCWLWSMCLEPQGSGWRQVPGSLVPLGGFWPPWELFYGIKSPFFLKQQIFYRILYFHGFSSHSKIPAWQTCIKEVCCFPFLKGGSWCQDGYCNHVASCNHCHGILRLSQANRCRREAAWSVQQLGDHYRKQVIDMWFSDFAPRHIMIRIWRIWWGHSKLDMCCWVTVETFGMEELPFASAAWRWISVSMFLEDQALAADSHEVEDPNPISVWMWI